MNENERTALNTDLLNAFVTIADCGNLTVAAGHLFRTQSAISVQLRKLETDLGVVLFDRNSRGMTLTDAGHKLLPRARTILGEIRETAALFDEPLTGSIHVGIPDDFDDTVLERILIDFGRTHPGVDVVATSGCTSTYPQAIANGQLDVAVCSGPDNEKGELLETERTVWAAKKGFRLSADQPVPLAILDRNCWWRNLPAAALESVGRDHTVAFRSSSFTSIKTAIRAGFAIGILPEPSVDDQMMTLSTKQGFPELPSSKRSILVGNQTRDDLASAMNKAIRSARLLEAA